MFFDVEQGSADGVAVVVVRGELDVSTVPVLEKATAAQLAACPPRLLLDLSATTFLDSTGARHLARTARSARDREIAFQVLCPPDNRAVRRAMDLLDLQALVDVVDQPPSP